MKKEMVFNKEDIERAIIKWYQKLWLWLFRTKEQWTDEGWIVRYKEVGGRIYIIKIGRLK